MIRARTALVVLLAACSGAASGPVEPPFDPTRDVAGWVMQLQGLERPGAIDRLSRADADLVVIDPLRSSQGHETFPTAAVVAQLRATPGRRAARKRCLAYVNVGQAEDYRIYWEDDWRAPSPSDPGRPPFLVSADPDGWPGNYPVAYWDPAWAPVLFGTPRSLVDQALADGFDGVVLDWVAGWSDARVAERAARDGVDPAHEMTDLVRRLAAYARERRPGFLVFPLNAAELVEREPGLVASIDGVVQESVSFRGAASSNWDDPENADVAMAAEGDWSTATHVRQLGALRAQGLAVLTIDYATRPEKAAAARALAARHGFVPFVTRTSLDRLPDDAIGR